jgi:hypothetical protein
LKDGLTVTIFVKFGSVFKSLLRRYERLKLQIIFNLAPKLPSSKDKDFLKKKTYGKTPGYLTKIKNEIQDEYNLVKEMQIEEQNEKDKQKMLMPEEERAELIAALKRKWEQLHLQYQRETHHNKLDTLGKKNRKENLEKEMD